VREEKKDAIMEPPSQGLAWREVRVLPKKSSQSVKNKHRLISPGYHRRRKPQRYDLKT
jgi:hypothetical protein